MTTCVFLFACYGLYKCNLIAMPSLLIFHLTLFCKNKIGQDCPFPSSPIFLLLQSRVEGYVTVNKYSIVCLRIEQLT